MKNLLTYSDSLLDITSPFTRYLYQKVDWNSPLIGITGSRGVGKTMFVLQHLSKSGGGSPSTVYISLDNLYFATHSLINTVSSLYSEGLRRIALDDVHKYPGWPNEVQTIRERYPDLQIIYIASSVVDFEKEGIKLHKEAELHHLQGLSYREYLLFKHDMHFDAIDINTLLQSSRERQTTFPSDFRSLRYFKDYLEQGYYPFFANESASFNIQLQNVVRLTVEYDMAELKGFDVRNAKKLLKLTGIIAESAPFKPVISKLADKSGIHRNSMVPYLHYLEKAGLISLLYPNEGEISALQKPNMVYLSNPNLAWCLNPDDPESENIRKTFILSQLHAKYHIQQPVTGDFIADATYTFVVDEHKPGKTISGLDLVTLSQDLDTTSRKDSIPLWMFGLLY